ncbi:MAG: septum formation initiator family protein [Alistipes sp.]|nr:septum formation initiator family protein [Alistipes sp.]
MKDSTKEKIIQYFWRGLILAIAVYTVIVCISTIWDITHINIRRSKLDERIAKLESKIAADSTFVEQIQHSPEFIEAFAREQYHMQRRGETVYILEE